MYLLIFGGIALLSYVVQSNLQRNFKEYSKEYLSNGMTGQEVAEKMLRDHGIYNVKVISTPGQLTDHYNPSNLTVNLSESVYNERSVAAAAVAAHECGHAVQHTLALRSPEDALGISARRELCQQLGAMGAAIRRPLSRSHPLVPLHRHCPFCLHHGFRLHHPPR